MNKDEQWTERMPTEDGTYLCKFDPMDDDSDAEEFDVRGGQFLKAGKPWVCYGGFWKRKELGTDLFTTKRD